MAPRQSIAELADSALIPFSRLRLIISAMIDEWRASVGGNELNDLIRRIVPCERGLPPVLRQSFTEIITFRVITRTYDNKTPDEFLKELFESKNAIEFYDRLTKR